MMRRAVLILLLILALILPGCTKTPEPVQTEAVPIEYGAAIEQAKAEFSTIFASHENLKIEQTATMARTDDSNHIVIQFTYTSDSGNGVYGFEYTNDPVELIRHGEDITIDNLVK